MLRLDHTPLLTQASLPSTPGPVLITLPAADSSILEKIRTVKVDEDTRFLHPLVSIVPSQRSSHPALSASDTDANGVYTDDLTPWAHAHGSSTGENSQVSVAASLPSPHPGPHPIIIDPLTGLVPQPLSVLDPGYVFDASQCPTLATTLPSPPESNHVQDIAAPGRSQSSAKFRPRLILCPSPSSEVVPLYQKSEEVIVVTDAIFSGQQSSPIQTPAIHGDGIPVGPPLHPDSDRVMSPTHQDPHQSSATTRPYTSPWPSSVFLSPVKEL